MENNKSIVIDQGNTMSKIATFIDSEIQDIKRVPNEDFNISEVMSSGVPCIYSSVAENSNAGVKIVHEMGGIGFSYNTPIPVKINYHSPETLGLDRIANACAVIKRYKFKNALVIDAGSCVTYDLILDSTFVGGAISPGMSMRFRAMNNFTGGLPLATFEAKAEWPGDTTNSCLQVGVFSGLVSEMNGFIDAAKLQSNNLEVVITGGESPHFARALKCSIFADPNLTLKGLHEILLFNSK
jgi:type III pantothenate kinase